VRVGLSTLASTTTTDCHVPSASRPGVDGARVRLGLTNAGSTWSAPCPGLPCRCRHRSSRGSTASRWSARSSSEPAPVSSSASPAVAWGRNTCSSPSPPTSAANAAHSVGDVGDAGRVPGRSRQLHRGLTPSVGPERRPYPERRYSQRLVPGRAVERDHLTEHDQVVPAGTMRSTSHSRWAIAPASSGSPSTPGSGRRRRTPRRPSPRAGSANRSTARPGPPRGS
jgi:hypothetical protein